MIRFLADEDWTSAIVRGVRRRFATIDIVRVQDVGLRTHNDSAVLDWCFAEQRLLLTHDARTIPTQSYDRIVAGQPFYEVFIVHQATLLPLIIDDSGLIATCSDTEEWIGRVHYLPLR